MSRRWISLPRSEGETSRQAHADLPVGSFERELGKEGFFGPATHMYHRHPPTGWSAWEGPLKPRAFDLAKLGQAASPWEAPLVLGNAQVKLRYWRAGQAIGFFFSKADGAVVIVRHTGARGPYFDVGPLCAPAGAYNRRPPGPQA